MPRFVLLEHDHPFLHWDLMLEWGTVLRTWRLDRIPAGAASIPVEPLPDHRVAYLNYEGPVSGHRGTVTRIDRGDFTLVSPAEGMDHEGQVVVLELAGSRLRGTARFDGRSPVLHWQPERSAS